MCMCVCVCKCVCVWVCVFMCVCVKYEWKKRLCVSCLNSFFEGILNSQEYNFLTSNFGMRLA